MRTQHFRGKIGFSALQSTSLKCLGRYFRILKKKSRQAKKTGSRVISRVRGHFQVSQRLTPIGCESVTSSIRHFANPGPLFEEANAQDLTHRVSRARVIAFYLPQFYAFAENDSWWGKGFTEWRNVSRGTPRYAGHYQPRIPRDLGFYDLTNADTLREQSALAKRSGVEAFCFYYYWFNGKRLMDKPLDLFISAGIEQEFCIMWANENWTRSWDGLDSEVLIEQNYKDADEDAFIADTARYMMHPKYVKVDGRPLFILYRPGLLPDAQQTIQRWREKWESTTGISPWILMVQGFGNINPCDFGLDGAVEFPPLKLCENIPDMNQQLRIFDPEYRGQIRSYAAIVDRSLGESAVDYPLIKTVSPHWDNDARREASGLTMHGSTPDLYEKWLNGAIDYADKNPFSGESIVFVNAWNEWAEGAYLEPDVYFGHAYLNATQRAVKGLVRVSNQQKILLVGHDAYRHGAQMLLLNLAQTYKEQFDMEVVILLKEGGVLLGEYRKWGRVLLLNSIGRENIPDVLQNLGVRVAICNTSVTGDLVPLLKRSGLQTVSLIHELPNLIREYGLQNHLQDIATHSDHVIFPSKIVQNGFRQFVSDTSAKQLVKPQGSYKKIGFDAAARQRIRSEFGLLDSDKLVLNVGFADLRKGFDLFLQTARYSIPENNNHHFVWVGALSDDMQRWVQSDLDNSELAQRIHFVGFTDSVTDYYSAADCFYLSSREDPYPTVVLEAMNVGLPVVLYKGATGFDEVMQQYGWSVALNDVSGVAQALDKALNADTQSEREARIRFVEQECRLDDYCFGLIDLLHSNEWRSTQTRSVGRVQASSDRIDHQRAA